MFICSGNFTLSVEPTDEWFVKLHFSDFIVSVLNG